MAKIESGNSQYFFINDIPKQRGQYEIVLDWDNQLVGIRMVGRDGWVEGCELQPVDNYTDASNTPFPSLAAFFLYVQNIMFMERGGGSSIGPVDWADITNKPITFPPASHGHIVADIVNFPNEVRDVVGAMVAAGSGIAVNYNPTTKVLTISSTVAVPTNEDIQDVVGAMFQDSDSIDFSYSDPTNTITAFAIPEGIDHNRLLNYVLNQHIDHSAVNIVAGTGLTGGGNITTSRTLSIANTGVTAGTYGSASKVPVFVVNERGQLISVTNIDIAINAAAVAGFNEAAQDAIAAALQNSATVQFVYDDSANTITAHVIAGGIDHNALLNYVPQEHIDHRNVSITGTDGLIGGGDITNSRQISMPNIVASGTYGNEAFVPVITLDTKGRVTSVTPTAISILSTQISDSTAAGRALLTAPDVPTQRTILGIQSQDTINWISARVATTANITLSGLQTIDGISLAAGNRVLVWKQTNPVQNGIYIVSAGTWNRAGDASTTVDFVRGKEINILDGNTHKGAIFINNTPDPVTIGSSNIEFIKSSADLPRVSTNNVLLGRWNAGGGRVEEIVIGANLFLSGNTLNANTSSYSDADAINAVVNLFQDSASIDFTANASTISAIVLPAGVNHNALQNYVLNEHINHANVFIDTPVAGGIQGGGDITSSRTLTLRDTGVVAGTYNYATITVDSKGRVTAASSGTANFVPTNRTITINGQTFDLSLNRNWDVGTVTQINTGTGLTGGPITTSGTISLANTTVVPGNYTNANITVDAQGRITAASSGSSSSITLNQGTLAGRGASSGTGTPEQITLGTGLIMTGTTLRVDSGNASVNNYGVQRLGEIFDTFGAIRTNHISFTAFSLNTLNAPNDPTAQGQLRFATVNTTPGEYRLLLTSLIAFSPPINSDQLAVRKIRLKIVAGFIRSYFIGHVFDSFFNVNYIPNNSIGFRIITNGSTATTMEALTRSTISTTATFSIDPFVYNVYEIRIEPTGVRLLINDVQVLFSNTNLPTTIASFVVAGYREDTITNSPLFDIDWVYQGPFIP